MAQPSIWRRIPEAALLSGALFWSTACGSNVERIPVTSFTEGVETELEEVAPGDWRIADERVVADTNATRVIARGLNGVTDTFGLAELQQTDATAPNGSDSTATRRHYRRSGFSSILLYGLIGNRLMGGRSGFRPNPGAYTNQSTFNRVQNTTGTRLNSTARKTTARPSGGRSGYGKGARSGRGYGG